MIKSTLSRLPDEETLGDFSGFSTFLGLFQVMKWQTLLCHILVNSACAMAFVKDESDLDPQAGRRLSQQQNFMTFDLHVIQCQVIQKVGNTVDG